MAWSFYTPSGPVAPAPVGLSTTSAELQAVSAQAASAIASEISNRVSADNVLSTAINVVSNAISNEASVRLASVQTASAAATSVNNRVDSVNTFVSGISARSVGGISTHGLQSVVDALSNRISAVAGGTASVTSQELSVAAADLSSRIQSVVTSASMGNIQLASILDLSVVATPAAPGTSIARIYAGMDNGFVRLRAKGPTGQVIELAQDQYFIVKNVQGTSIHQGKVVHITGGVGASGTAEVQLADATDPTKVPGDGVVADLSIANNGFGRVMAFGVLASIDTSPWPDGTHLFLATSAGELSTVGATYPNYNQHIAVVINQHASQGVAHVHPGATRTPDVTSALNTISNLVSAAEVHASTASAAATSADSHANTVSAAVETLSAKVVSISAQLVSIETHASTASTAAANADTHANTASAAATSVDNRVNSVNTFISGISARTSTGGATSIHGFQSVINALSSQISNEASIRLASVQTASAAATSADSHANTVSAAVETLSAKVVSISAQIVSVDTHANTASAAATSVDGRVNSLNTFISGISARSVGGISTHGFQSVIDALSNRISATGAGVASVTSNELSAVEKALSDRVNSVNTFISGISARSVGDVSTHGFQSIINALSNRISASGGTASVTSQELSVAAAGLSGRIDSVETHAATASAAATSVDNRVASLSVYFASLSGRTSVGGATSIHGLQSIINALSSQISNEQSIRLASVQTASAAATSADAHANTVSAAVETLSAKVVSISAQLASLEVHASAASAAATSVDARVGSLSAFFASLSARTSVGGATSIHGLQSIINALSTQILNEASIRAVSVANAQSAAINASTIGSIAALSLAIVNDASVSAAIIQNLSLQQGSGQYKMVTGAQAIATAVFTKVSGLSLSLGGSNFYEVHGQLIWSQSGAGSASAIFNFGMSCTQTPVMAMFKMIGNTGAMIAAGGLSAFTQFGGNSAMCATPSIMYSVKPNPGASGSVANTMFFDGVIQCSTAAGTLEVVVATSTAAFGVNIVPGSYIKAFRIG